MEISCKEKKKSFVFRHCPILRLLLLRFLLRSLIMEPDLPSLSRDQYTYLYGNQRKNDNSSKMKKHSSEVTDPFQ